MHYESRCFGIPTDPSWGTVVKLKCGAPVQKQQGNPEYYLSDAF